MSKPRVPKGKGKSISRRTFVEAAGGAASAALVGCKTLNQDATLQDVQPDLSTIVRAAVHPGIGVARMGNSTASDGFFIGPEVTTPPLVTEGQSRDGSGALKRQAARFRIYGYDDKNRVVAELTPDNATIAWQVHLVNKKAQGYRFGAALDIPETSTLSLPLRNASVTGDARRALAIDPGPRSIQGKSASGPSYRFDSGTFMKAKVVLGEIMTDDAGRLVVLGGEGVSGSPANTPIIDATNATTIAATFNNADGWYDDTSDGPVTAKVTVGGKDIPVDGGWVMVAPPNFAPNVVGWRSLYDLLIDIYIDAGIMQMPARTSFNKHVLPALRRLSGLQWVNAGFAAAFGKGAMAFDFEDPKLIASLAQRPTDPKSDPNASLRKAVYNSFRTVDALSISDWPWPAKGWPWLYGDAYGLNVASARNNLMVSNARTAHLQRWVEGDFDADWDPNATLPDSIDQVSVADQPAMLDEAALTFLLADAFHPGCELTWPMRHATIYSAPFRIKAASADLAPLDFGPALTEDIALGPNGPLNAQAPGDLTKWMALPWQGDTAMCRSGYDVVSKPNPNPQPRLDAYLPTFWPARVPNQVLSQSDYATVMDTTKPRDQRIKAFQTRVDWYHTLSYQGDDFVKTMLSMVAEFGNMGVVEARPGLANDPDFPATIQVESPAPSRALALTAEDDAQSRALSEDPVVRAGWRSAEQVAAFRKVRGLR